MIIFGAGDHSKILNSVNPESVKFFFDDNDGITSWCNKKVIPYDSTILSSEPVIIGIGDNVIRKRIVQKVNHEFTSLKHDSAVIALSVKIELGSQILHNATIQADAIIGNHVIVNTKASIDHDCKIEDYVHIAPGATLCGNVTVGEGTLIGAGAVILPNTVIGSWCTIGAGSVVTKNVQDGAKVYGNPAK